MRRRSVWLSAAVVTLAVITGGLAWFQPWKLFVDHTVNETLPAVAVAESPAADVTVAGEPAASEGSVTTPSSPRTTRRARQTAALLARGRLITHEHETSGRVSVVRQPDGSRALAIADLRTSDGPDVRVWLTDQPVRSGGKGWYVFDDGRHVDLGELKGNRGNQVYRIPTSVDLNRFTSVSLWCNRFDVSFGAAALTPPH